MLSTFAVLAMLAPAAMRAQDSSMAGMPMDKSTPDAVTAGVNEQMNDMAMDSPHMRMTPLEPAKPGDAARADSVVTALRASLVRYQDYKVALADGFQIFLPKVPQKVYHFTNYHSAVYAAFTFDPARPSSLLYEKTASGYKLVGAMYTAPKGMTLEALNARVPLSVAQWHVHVNICVPPRGSKGLWTKTENGKLLFGPKGTIDTESACEAAGGRFIPQLFGWMVHVNPYATDPALVWGTHEHEHDGHGQP
jgi:hypothetical protein